MIAYSFPTVASTKTFHQALLDEIDILDKAKGRKQSWRVRAAAALRKFAAPGKAGAKKPSVDSLWSEIKPVFALLQNGKCAFCERLLGADELMAYEQDMEHFRPKKGVEIWPPANPIGRNPYPADLPPTPGRGAGYRKLPYHELNYVVSCKTCNTRCKANYFPVAEKHWFAARDPVVLLKKEQPYLIYPLGGLDDDPETIITFIGYKAFPAQPPATARLWNRGRVTIAFFLLNDDAREDQLLLQRAARLDFLGYKIEAFERSKPADRQRAWDAVKAEGSAREPFANCVRSMIRLYAQNPPAARDLIEQARVYRRSMLDLKKWRNSPAPPTSP